ncbi:MAG: hypothetical protein HY722_05890, partial [Planctomycetes bacterium]|nr:hypothetical protein [Planctomycetota bacterium]
MSCPPREVLARLAEGDPAAGTEAASHLAVCEACRAALAEDRLLLDRLRAAAPGLPLERSRRLVDGALGAADLELAAALRFARVLSAAAAALAIAVGAWIAGGGTLAPPDGPAGTDPANVLAVDGDALFEEEMAAVYILGGGPWRSPPDIPPPSPG